MKVVKIPKEVLAAEIRAGRVTLFRMAGRAASGPMSGTVDAVATAGLAKAGQAGESGAVLLWPECCCTCLKKGGQVRPVESTSIANRVVAYVFKFRVPHCPTCAKTANRKRPGAMGLAAAFLALSVPVIIVMMGVGAATNRDGLIMGSFVVGPLVGLAVPYAWRKLRRPRYQAVHVSDIEVGLSGVPTGFTVAFESDAYAAQFVALNRAAGVVAT
jgi:hypothetical protein